MFNNNKNLKNNNNNGSNEEQKNTTSFAKIEWDEVEYDMKHIPSFNNIMESKRKIVT